MNINGSMPSVLNPGDVPSRITPGLPKELTNQRMTQYNDLRYAALRSPHMMQMVARHFAQGTGFLSELLMMMGKDYNPGAAAERKKRKVEGAAAWKDSILSKNIKVIDDQEFCWRGYAPTGFIYKVITSVPEQVVGSGMVGQDEREFPLTLNKCLGDMDDVILLNDGNTQVKVTAPPVFNTDGTMTVRVRILLTRAQAPYAANIGVPIDMLTRGSECTIIYNQKPEASEHGSKVRVEFGDWYREFMTTMRYEWNITGLTKATKINAKWMTYWDNGGQPHAYWMDTLDYEMMKKLAIQRENMLFLGKPDINRNGEFRTDMMGRPYFSGTGMYHQCTSRLKREYNSLNDFTIFDNLLRDMNYDSQYTQPILFMAAGMEFRTDFDKLIRNEFKYSPEVLFVQEGNLKGAPAGTAGMGLQSNFTYYSTPLGKIIVSPCNYFDNKWMPTRRTAQGTSEQSHRAIIVNIADELGGQDNINLVTLAGRSNVVKDVNGMAGDAGKVLSTTADVMGRHLLDMSGIAVANPNCMAELRLARR